MTLSEVASLINVAEPTLRTWLFRGQFPKYVIVRLANLLGWKKTPDELASEYGITAWARPRGIITSDEESVTLAQVLEFQDRFCDKINDPKNNESVFSENMKGLCRCFEAMHDGDLFVFSSLSVEPLEFKTNMWQPFGRAVADALSNGGVCLYLTPNEEVIKRFTASSKWGYDNMVREDTFKADCQNYRNLAKQYLLFTGTSEKEANESVHGRLIHLQYQDCPFQSPGFAIGMFQTKDGAGTVVRRMTVRVPTDMCGVLFLPEEKENLFTYRFLKFVRKTVEEHLGAPGTDVLESLQKIHKLLISEFVPGFGSDH